MESPLTELARIADSLPDDARARILEQVDSLQNEALAPVGHTMRYLAQVYNDLSFRRRDAVVAGIRDPILQQQIKATPLGMSTFFKEDVSRDIDTSAQRH